MVKDWKKDFRKWVVKNTVYTKKKNIKKFSIITYMAFMNAWTKETSLNMEEVIENAQICEKIILEEYDKGSFKKKK